MRDVAAFDASLKHGAYGRTDLAGPVIVLWRGHLNEDGTASEDYVEIAGSVDSIKALIQTMEANESCASNS